MCRRRNSKAQRCAVPDSGQYTVIEHPTQKGYFLAFGTRPGMNRPAIWLQRGATSATIASFHGPDEVKAYERFILDLVGTLNEIHDAHKKPKDGPSDQPRGG